MTLLYSSVSVAEINLNPTTAFPSSLCRHNTYLQECTGQREPTYQLNIHDTKLLFLRFATEQSFSVDTGGGGRESNIHLIPYIIHTVLYVLNTYVPDYDTQMVYSTTNILSTWALNTPSFFLTACG